MTIRVSDVQQQGKGDDEDLIYRYDRMNEFCKSFEDIRDRSVYHLMMYEFPEFLSLCVEARRGHKDDSMCQSLLRTTYNNLLSEDYPVYKVMYDWLYGRRKTPDFTNDEIRLIYKICVEII